MSSSDAPPRFSMQTTSLWEAPKPRLPLSSLSEREAASCKKNLYKNITHQKSSRTRHDKHVNLVDAEEIYVADDQHHRLMVRRRDFYTFMQVPGLHPRALCSLRCTSKQGSTMYRPCILCKAAGPRHGAQTGKSLLRLSRKHCCSKDLQQPSPSSQVKEIGE